MKTKLVILAAGLQLAVLVFMAAQRELVVRSGETVYLRTMPVDPRDIFRGDYVRLRYEISQVPASAWQDELRSLTNAAARDRRRAKDRRVYAVLERDARGVGTLRALTGRRPEEGLFIRGRTDTVWTGGMAVRYGLEAFFVEQGRGLELERGRTRPDGIRVPLEMETAVGVSGLAVLKGFRWCPLGIGLSIETNAAREPVGATLTLFNASDAPLAVVDPPGGRAFALEPDAWGRHGGRELWRWVGEDAAPPPVQDAHVRILQPGDTHVVTLPHDDPAWFVKQPGGEPASLGELEGRRWQRFRFVYRPPAPEDAAHLRQADLLWHGRLHSSAFTGANVD